MKKIKLFLAAMAAMLGVQTSFAQQEPVSGSAYYLYNVETGKFLTRGDNWGTKAVTNDFGSPWQVTISDGAYTLRMYDIVVADGTSGLGDNGFSDNGSPIAFTPSGDVSGYTLTNGSNVLVSPDTYGNSVLAASGNSTWQFLNPTEYAAVLAAKTTAQEAAVATAAGIDISGSTLAAVVGNTDDYTATDMSSSVPFPSNSSWTRTGVANRNGDANQGTYGIERYQGGGTESYTVTGLAEGVYKVGIKAMFRSTWNANCYTIGEAGYTNSSAYFSANEKLVQIKDWYSSCTSNSAPNSTGDFVTIANDGGYYAEVYTYVGSDGVLELKAVSESYWNGSWFLFNGCTLTYYLDNSATIVLPESIALSQNSATLTTGSTLTLTGTVTPEDALDKSLTWSSSNETVATVDANGVVTALKAGTATITATSNADTNVTATCTVTVADAGAPAFYSEIAAGDFYIVNAATGQFLGGGNAWGTQASLIEHGIPFTAAVISDGVYTLDSHTYNSATAHFVSGTYVDGASTNLYITSVGDGKYSISTADGSAYMTAKAASTVVDNTAANASSSLAQWYFVSKNDRDKTLAAATTANPVDATYYIPNAGFSRNQNTSYNENTWAVTANNSNLASSANCAESYHSTFNVTKTISLPNGTYKFRAQGFYRQDGSDNDNLPEFFVGDQTITFPLRTGTEASMDAAAASFAAGSYYTDYVTVTVTDRTLTLGCRLETNTALWCIWDNFELYMTGYTANTGVTAEIDKEEIEVGATATITAATDPADASFNALTYSSSDESVATVDEDGVVTGVAFGTATITITANEMEEFSTTVDVTVGEEVTVTLAAKAGKYGTVIFPFTPDVSSYENIKFYSCTGEINENKIQLQDVDAPVANVPYLILNDGNENFSEEITGWSATTADSDTDVNGMLTGVYKAITVPEGSYVLQTQGEGDNAVQAFYKVNGEFIATPYRCYLTVPGADVKAFFFGDIETGIEAIDEAVNGKSSNGKWYNLAGQRVTNAQKGLYIVNGKKVVK